MIPLVRPMDFIHICALGDGRLGEGDIIAVPRGGGVIVHRVVARAHGRILLCGDNCRTADGVFAPVDIIGVVTRVERNGRSVWFGAGWLGPVVAWAVRHGLIWRANRAYYGLRRRAGRAWRHAARVWHFAGRSLKFLRADSRLPAQKGDDGNE
jgi:hypothetical protein